MASKKVVKDPEREKLIDEFGDLDLKIQQFAPIVAQHKTLREQIEGWYAAAPAAQAQLARGKRYTIQLGARRLERTITNPSLAFDLLAKTLGGVKAAIAVISIPLGSAIDKFIPASEHGQFLKSELTGPRTFKCVANS